MTENKKPASHLGTPSPAAARRHAAISRRAKAIADRLNSNVKVDECDNAEDHAILLLNREEAKRLAALYNCETVEN